MIFNYNGARIYYNVKNEGQSRPIILLHGWGRSGKDFEQFIEFNSSRTYITVDFPPFGESEKELVGWSIWTYAGMLMSLCDYLKIGEADFVGHSFGGRVLLILCAVKRSLVRSCIFVDSAGMKPKRSIKFRAKQAYLKTARKLGFKVHMKGSADYELLSPQMKETFKSIVNTHLEDYARKTTVPTLIVWGRKDNVTPLYMAKRMNRLIKNSRLEIIEDGSHFSFMECPLEFFAIASKFYKEVK